MGWCSGTEIFDIVCSSLLGDDREFDTKEVIKSLIKTLWDGDWDCEYDSRHINDPLVRECFIELDDEWEEHFKEMDDWR